MGGVVIWKRRRPRVWFHVGNISPYHRILTPDGSYESTEAKMKQLLMHRVTALNYLDMDEVTFEAFILPHITSLRFGTQAYYLTEQLTDAVYTLIELSAEDGVQLHLVD